jgi:O-methyltransferase involved in polyketide biosynthesis
MYEIDKLHVEFTGVRITALITLYARWLDSKDRHSFLNDQWARAAMNHLDFDFSQLAPLNYARFTIAARTHLLDIWVERYLSTHSRAVVLDLGCGFDSRVFRLDPSPTHQWFDVDFPDIAQMRSQLLPQRHNQTNIGASLTESSWLNQIPNDRAAIVIADSVLMFMAEDDVLNLFSRLANHFPQGEFVFTSYSAMVKRRETKRGLPPFFVKYQIAPTQWTTTDSGETENLDPRFHLLERRSQVDPRLHADAPVYDRLMCALIYAYPPARYSGAIQRYRF